MADNLIITKRAEELLDDLIYQLINKYKCEDTVFVLGIFHQLENYWIKV